MGWFLKLVSRERFGSEVVISMNSRSRRKSKKKPVSSKSPVNRDPGERLQKVLARAGVGSRRACEKLIQEGRVEVDGKVVTELGTRVDAFQQKIRVDGEVRSGLQPIYYMVNKPPGVVSTNRDPAGRIRVIDLIQSDVRLFPVGRLDRTSEGLILVTNDGQLANRLTHPRYQVSKTYLARVVGRIRFPEIKKLHEGMHLAEGYAQPESVRIKGHQRQSTDLEIVLREGRNREIRRLLARVGHKVISLRRTAVGNLKLRDLPSGAYRKLTPREVQQLEKLHVKGAKRGDGSGPMSEGGQRTSGVGRKKSSRQSRTSNAKTKGKSLVDRKQRPGSQAQGRQVKKRGVQRKKKGSSP